MLYEWPEWLLFAILFAAISAAAESGFRLGRRFALNDPAAQRETSLVATSMLAVLGLLLGFSMSMAVSRFEMRKLLVIQEANALGTSYLRTQLLPEANRIEIATALRAYLEARIRCGEAGENLARINSTYAEALRIQKRVWDRTVAYSRTDPNPVTSGLLLQSLNESIDLAESRRVAFFNHVPETVVWVDALIAVLSAILIGYELGVEGTRQLFTTGVLTLTIALIWIAIIDMDRPHHGLIQIGQAPLLELHSRLERD